MSQLVHCLSMVSPSKFLLDILERFYSSRFPCGFSQGFSINCPSHVPPLYPYPPFPPPCLILLFQFHFITLYPISPFLGYLPPTAPVPHRLLNSCSCFKRERFCKPKDAITPAKWQPIEWGEGGTLPFKQLVKIISRVCIDLKIKSEHQENKSVFKQSMEISQGFCDKTWPNVS